MTSRTAFVRRPNLRVLNRPEPRAASSRCRPQRHLDQQELNNKRDTLTGMGSSRTVINLEDKQEAQLSPGQPTVLAVSDIQGHPSSLIFISCERAYATSY